jgi:hypothetical protein
MKLDMTTTALLALAATAGLGLYVLYQRKPSAPQRMAGDDETPPPEAFVPGMDVDLSPEQSQAVGFALSKELDAPNLQAFSASMLPDFPLAAGMLQAKAKLLGGT